MPDFADFKKFFIYNLIGSLIIAALVAVVTVLVGSFNEVTGRALWTLFMVVAHSFISLAFIWNDERDSTSKRFSFFTNVLFVLIVVSFLISIFGIWKILSWEVVAHTYQTFFILLFAALHGNILAKALGNEEYIDWTVYINYVFMTIVVLMLLPMIYLGDQAYQTLGSMYYRFLAAAGIIDGTLSILTIIFHKMYIHAHPKAVNELADSTQKSERNGLSIWVWILIIYLLYQVLRIFSYSFYS